MGFRRVLFRSLGRAYQADGGRAATARAVAAANQEIHRARVRTKAARRQAQRREVEGTTLADLRYGDAPEKPPVDWKPVAELSEVDWLQERTRPEERRVGKECDSRCRLRWEPSHSQTKLDQNRELFEQDIKVK